MRLRGLVVSVDYADYLAKGLPLWLAGLDELLVVTTPTDKDTFELCGQDSCCFIYQTLAFYENGAVFNKGAAIGEAVNLCNWLEDWTLFFDADVIPPANWREIVEAANPQPGYLYGATRCMEDGSTNRWDHFEIPGYFQLFHASDKNVQKVPLMDCSWRHGGGYDSEFQARWDASRKVRLPLTLIHQGETGRHWWGRNNVAAMDEMLSERSRTHKLAESERITIDIKPELDVERIKREVTDAVKDSVNRHCQSQ